MGFNSSFDVPSNERISTQSRSTSPLHESHQQKPLTSIGAVEIIPQLLTTFGGSLKLQMSNVSVKAASKNVLTNIDALCLPGEITGLVGVSGAGKTTALHCLGLLIAPDEGAVLVNGEATAKWPDKKRRLFWRNQATFIFQDYGLVDEESVAYNIALGVRSRKAQESIDDALAMVGLEGRGSETISRLSGGEKQRVGLARAIAKGATCIFADEPTASLDAKNRSMVIQLLRERAQAGATVVLATHDEEAMEACNSLIRLVPPAQMD